MGEIDKEIKLNLLPPKTIFEHLYRISNLIFRSLQITAFFFILWWFILLSLTIIYTKKAKNYQKNLRRIPNLEKAKEINKNINFKNKLFSFLQKISEQRSNWGEKLTEISWMVPWNMWLNNITIISPFRATYSTVSFEGKAQDNYAIISFLKKLERTTWLEEVKLDYSHKEVLNGKEINTFKIICKSKN